MTDASPLHPQTREFLDRPCRMLIGGKSTVSEQGQTTALLNPATATHLIDVPRGTPADIDHAVRQARRAFDDSSWSRMRPRERQNLLLKLADLLEIGRASCRERG